jgi:hypothetical protein
MFNRCCFAALLFIWHGAALAADTEKAAKEFQKNYFAPKIVSVLSGWQGNDSAVTAPSVERIMDDASWTALWRRHDPASPPPAIDFSKAMVIAIFTGSVSASVYGIHLEGVFDKGDIGLTSGVFVSDVIDRNVVSLYLFVVLPRSTKAITVVEHSFGLMMSPRDSYETVGEFDEIH